MAAKPYESGDLRRDTATATEDLNRASVHVADEVKNAIERAKATPDAKHVAAMKKLQESLESILEDATALAAKEQPAPKEKSNE